MEIVGNVWTAATQTPISAEIVFSRPSAYPGGADHEVSTTTNDMFETPAGAASYRVKLPASMDESIAYDLLIQPTGSDRSVYPPIRVKDVKPPGDHPRGAILAENFTYDVDAFPSISGILVTRDTSGTVTEEEHLVVRAIDRCDSAEVISNTVSTGESTQSAGGFSLLLAPEEHRTCTQTGYLIRVSGGSKRPLFPELVFDPNFFFNGENDLRLLVPSIETTRIAGTVQTMNGGLVPEALLSFETETVLDPETGIVGSFRTTTETDQEGSFAVELLAAEGYRVTITPPLTSIDTDKDPKTPARDLGVRVIEAVAVTLDSSQKTVFQVHERTLLNIELTAADGITPFITAAITANAVDDAGRTSLSNAHRTTQIAPVEKPGHYEARLDQGEYNVVLRPQSSSGYPWRVLSGVTVGSTPLFVQTQIPVPVPVYGRLIDSEGNAMPRAEVEFFGLITLAEGNPRVLKIGTSTTTEEGYFRALLPPTF
ncbi:MAG: hypothetical protein AAF355_03350 [Myxococcota bacterium]